MRRTRLRYRQLQIPLWIDAPSSFNTYAAGRWTASAWHERGTEPSYGMMKRFIRNDVRVRGLGRDRPGMAWDAEDPEAAANPRRP